MQRSDFCQYVDVFYGNGETDRFFSDGLASKWFYIKALCGNTVPHATLPFGKMSVGAYSGGYPTGYGTHYPNFCGGIRKLDEVHRVRGFSHLHHSGTGAIRYYYNYAVTTPFYGDIKASREPRVLEDERACPGYYSARLGDVFCELTVSGGVAYHRYTFGSDGGRVAFDFSNSGLFRGFGESFSSTVKNPEIVIISNNEIAFSGEFYGVPLHFCVVAECDSPGAAIFDGDSVTDSSALVPGGECYGAVLDFSGRALTLKVGYSTISYERARDGVMRSEKSFDEARSDAYGIWNEHLSAIDVRCDDEELKRKLYSNLYHSLIKPSDMTGETILGVSGDTVTDFATFWDQYKTALPLVYMCYPEMSERIVRGIIGISRTLGKIPCSFGLSNVFPCEEQAKMLGILTLSDAYYMGIRGATASVIEECMERELSREDYSGFLQNGVFERYTHILDVTDACLSVAEITERPEFRERLESLAKFWKNAYAEDGIMSDASPYYEGDRYTYSFRIQKNMEERVALAGGKSRFLSLLDGFFGINGESVEQITHLDAYDDISRTAYHRFEGFNNECDMETPYAYIYADRHDRLCEIMHECVTRSFGLGRGALPGNNDSGGLSSLFVWNALGILPVSGSGIFLVGSPAIDGADIRLSSGNTLKIRVNRESKSQIYVDRILLDGRAITDYKISARELMRGGLLEFYMK